MKAPPDRDRPSRLGLVLVGALTGGVAGVIIRLQVNDNNTGADVLLWGGIGAVLLGATAPLTNGAILSAFARSASPGRNLNRGDNRVRRVTANDYPTLGALLAIIGIGFAASPRIEPLFKYFEGDKIYFGVALAAAAVGVMLFGFSKLPGKIVYPLGWVLFVGGGIYGYFTARAQFGL